MKGDNLMNKITKQLKELLEQSKRDKILGIGIVVKYNTGLEDFQKYGEMKLSTMSDCIATEKNIADCLGLNREKI